MLRKAYNSIQILFVLSLCGCTQFGNFYIINKTDKEVNALIYLEFMIEGDTMFLKSDDFKNEPSFDEYKSFNQKVECKTEGRIMQFKIAAHKTVCVLIDIPIYSIEKIHIYNENKIMLKQYNYEDIFSDSKRTSDFIIKNKLTPRNVLLLLNLN